MEAELDGLAVVDAALVDSRLHWWQQWQQMGWQWWLQLWWAGCRLAEAAVVVLLVK